MNFHLVFIIVGVLTVLGTFISLRREHIRAEYSVSWLLVGCVLTGLAVFPGWLDRIANRLSLDPQICFVITGGILISMLVFEISHVVSKLRDDNVMLTQRIAILEFHMQSRALEIHGDKGQ